MGLLKDANKVLKKTGLIKLGAPVASLVSSLFGSGDSSAPVKESEEERLKKAEDKDNLRKLRRIQAGLTNQRMTEGQGFSPFKTLLGE